MVNNEVECNYLFFFLVSYTHIQWVLNTQPYSPPYTFKERIGALSGVKGSTAKYETAFLGNL